MGQIRTEGAANQYPRRMSTLDPIARKFFSCLLSCVVCNLTSRVVFMNDVRLFQPRVSFNLETRSHACIFSLFYMFGVSFVHIFSSFQARHQTKRSVIH